MVAVAVKAVRWHTVTVGAVRLCHILLPTARILCSISLDAMLRTWRLGTKLMSPDNHPYRFGHGHNGASAGYSMIEVVGCSPSLNVMSTLDQAAL